MPDQHEVADALRAVTDCLVDDFDLGELLGLLARRCTELLDLDGAAVMLTAPDGTLSVMSSMAEQRKLASIFERQSTRGPARELDCESTGHVAGSQVVHAELDRWPKLTPVAVAAGCRTGHVVPLRLRGSTIGVFNLFTKSGAPLSGAGAEVAQTFADLASLAVVQNMMAGEAERVADQLAAAIDNQTLVNQAAGVLAERTQVTVEQAYSRMQCHALEHQVTLVDVALVVTHGPYDPALPDLVESEAVRDGERGPSPRRAT